MKMTREQLAKTLQNPALSVEGGKEALETQCRNLVASYESKFVKTAPEASSVRLYCKKCGAAMNGYAEAVSHKCKEHEPVVAKFSLHHTTDEAKLNKTEREYLGKMRLYGYPFIGIQNITLKLADDLRYTPDFSCIDENGKFVFHEVKGGFMREDSFIKIKTAARLFRMFEFRLCKKERSGWEYQTIKP